MTEERNLCDLSFLKMNMLPLKLRPLLKALTSNIEIRNIALSSVLGIKEIKQVQNDKELVIYGEIQPSPREPYLLKNEDHCCPICASGLDVKHTDVLILSQFVRSDGCMLPKRITGLCKSQQKRMGSLVTMAQKAGM
ncbi:hypothetical protein D910_03651 [Dendroctonus ponderosae]